jgi:hypothetical protein
MVGRGAWLVMAAACVTATIVAACSVGRELEPRASWRSDAEDQCLDSGKVRASAFVQKNPKVGGIACGMDHPLRVSGLNDGAVTVSPPATINCPMTAALDRWAGGPVQTAGRRYFGQPVVGIKQIASYGCRGRNGSHRGPLSEHAFGNALDIAAFTLADGREISVLGDWSRGSPQERGFLREVFASACSEFYTVLGPGSDRYHSNHLHVDLLLTNAKGGRHYCRPLPGRVSPEDVPVASFDEAPMQRPSRPLAFTGDLY